MSAEPRQASMLDCGAGNYRFHAVKQVPYGSTGWMWVACCGADHRAGGGTMSSPTVDANSIRIPQRCRAVACRKAFDEADRAAAQGSTGSGA